MSFLRPKVNIPPPPPAPPPPPPTVTPSSVVRPDTVVDATKKEMKKKKATMKTSQKTGPQGVTTEAPVEYKSLLGGK
tara:strand:- start:245 stop:475 length:231 start_codon:yes stop_codon:yes gene_type:complete